MAKLYGYHQLTTATEKRIQWLAEFARKEMYDRHRHCLVRNWAYGAVTLWADLTEGHQKPGDRERLDAMVDAIQVDEPANERAHA